MPIPAAQEIRKPLLEAFKGEAPRSFSAAEFLDLMAGCFGLNLNELSSGDKNTFRSRVNEAKNDLRKNHLLSNPSKNIYMITSAGLEVLEDNPAMISDEYLAARKNKPLTVEGVLILGENDSLMPPPPLELDPDPKELHDTLPASDMHPEITEPLPESDMPPQITEPTTESEMPPEITEPSPESDMPHEIESPHEDSEIAPENSEPQQEITPEAEAEYEPEKLQEQTPESEPESESENVPENEAMNEPEQIQHEETEYEHESDSHDEDSGFVITPAQRVEDVVTQYNSHLADEILMKTAAIPSDRFEMLVIDLLSKMGYFAFQTARYTTETAGRDLIHGVILDNKTGANIYIQARKLSPARTVGKADIQDFAKELADKGGKGIFATTANFSEQAKICANDERIMLIDGVKLANLMIANNFCVNVEKVFEVKSIDTETFSEYEE